MEFEHGQSITYTATCTHYAWNFLKRTRPFFLDERLLYEKIKLSLGLLQRGTKASHLAFSSIHINVTKPRLEGKIVWHLFTGMK